MYRHIKVKCRLSVAGSTASLELRDQRARFRHSKHSNLTYSPLPCLLDDSISGRNLSRPAAASGRANIDQINTSTRVSSRDCHVQKSCQEDVDKSTDEDQTNRVWRLVKVTARLLGLGMLLDPAFLAVSLIMALWVCKYTGITEMIVKSYYITGFSYT